MVSGKLRKDSAIIHCTPREKKRLAARGKMGDSYQKILKGVLDKLDELEKRGGHL